MKFKYNQSDNKLSNYVSYAFGEIILVVIGILIAVQVNNWNTKQNNIKNAKDYLQSFSNELKTDTLIFGNVISLIEEQIKFKKMIINNTKLDSLSVDYLDTAINTRYYNIKINDATFLEVKDPTIINLPKYRSVFKSINSYYTYQQDYLTNFNEWEVRVATRESVFWEEQGDFEISTLSFGADSIPYRQKTADRKKILIDKIYSIKGRNFLKINLYRLNAVKNQYTYTKKHAVKLIKEIDSISK